MAVFLFSFTVVCLTMFNETEKFVEANTQELAKDKWLCPLSGKKFRGPDFVRKHIFNKHMDKVEAVRMEVCFVLFLIIIITLYLRLSEFEIHMDDRKIGYGPVGKIEQTSQFCPCNLCVTLFFFR